MILNNVRSWATDLDPATRAQAERTARLPILAGPVALMPDAHLGYGATIGSVIATEGAIIPSAVGVDVGCGMHAESVLIEHEELSPHLNDLLSKISQSVPAGMGRNHDAASGYAVKWLKENQMPARFTDAQKAKAAAQLGTLGSGNHFVEVSTDQDGGVWIVLHSGSRGIGNEIAQAHIREATKDFYTVVEGYELEDPDLAWLVQGTEAFGAYWADLQWLQRYAKANRDAMFLAIMQAMSSIVDRTLYTRDSVDCHHNYATVEHHDGRDVYVTRKGAINAANGTRGIIPGSMGTATFLVEGKGNPDSWMSCSHGAGRKMSRTQARKTLTTDSFHDRMSGRTWLDASAERLLDEHPDAYKDIETVMEAQADLVTVTHRLEAILNYKG